MKKINLLVIITLLAVIISCEPTIDDPMGTGSLGTLGTDNKSFVYVAIGNSITGGGMDGAVFPFSLTFTYPKLLAGQMGVGEFVQADIAEPGIGNRMYLYGFDATGNPIIEISKVMSAVNNASYAKPFNNLGVYAAIANDLIDTSDFATRAVAYGNPFYLAILRSQQLGKSMVEQAINLNPNLITIEIGSNDVLWYAIYGGTKSTTGMPDNPIPTPPAAMQMIYTAALTKLTQSLPNTKIVMFTIPDVMGTPYFNTIPWNALKVDAATAAALNAAYAQLGFHFSEGNNGFVAASPKSPGGMRQMTKNDYIVLDCPRDSLQPPPVGRGWGSMVPIPNQYVLDSLEVLVVKQAITDYNAIINTLSSISQNIYIFDFNKIMTDITTTGYKVPGSTTMTAKYISGEPFSLDGLHLTAKGQGMIVNELIKFLNAEFGSDLPQVSISTLPANTVYKK
jgi:lysophospholipase L1-like esterase